MTSESALQKKIIEYLEKNKIYHINVFGSGRTAKGAPDIMACVNGQFVAFELKVNDNKKSSAQIIHMRRIKRSGGKHYTPYTFDDFLKAIDELGG